MSLDVSQGRARRSTRAWLFAPAAMLFLVFVASAAGWLWARGRLTAEMDGRAGALQRAGWTVRWGDRTLSGFPFRLKIVLDDVQLKAPGDQGWGVSAPVLEAQAYVVEPAHWVFAAPKGLTVLRPLGGPLAIDGHALRASVAGIGKAPWRIALEGAGLRFTPGPGARPFSFTAMQHAEAHLRPTPDGSGDGDVLLTMEGARAAPESFLARLAPSAAIALAASGRVTKLAQARGADWSLAVAAWSSGGGALKIDRLNGVAGPLHVTGEGARLSVDDDGFLHGAVPLAMTEAPEAPSSTTPALPAAGPGVALPIVFGRGRMLLGPVDVGRAPKLR